MTKKSKQNLAKGAVVVGLIFVAWKVWPAIKAKLSKRTAAGGGGGGVGPSSLQYPYRQNPSQQPQSSPSFGSSTGGQQPGSSSSNYSRNVLASFMNMIAADRQNDLPTLNAEQSSIDAQIAASTNNDSIAYQPLQNLDLGSWSPDDPNAPWNQPLVTDNSIGLDSSTTDQWDNSAGSDQTIDTTDTSSYYIPVGDDSTDYGMLDAGYGLDGGGGASMSDQGSYDSGGGGGSNY